MTKWDQYFYNLCTAVSTNVQCPSRSMGAVIVRNKHIVATGYNGPPSGFPNIGTREFRRLTALTHSWVGWAANSDSECPRKVMKIPSGEGLGFCPCAHAERNAIDSAARLGHPTQDCTLYLNNVIPCLDCAYSIVNSGIKEVVVVKLEEYPQEGFTGKIILDECGVNIREFELT